MKLINTLIIMTSLSLVAISSYADDRSSKYGRTYGDARYDLERKYPSPERRYSRKELDQARRRAGNSLWMDSYGHKDPIYRSDQYRGRSSRNYRESNREPYRKSRYTR